MSPTTGYAVPAVLLVIIGAGRIRAYRATRRPEACYLGLGLLTLAASLLFSVTAVITWLDQHVWHYPNVTVLLCFLAGVASACSSVELVVASATGIRHASQRVRVTAFGVAGALVIVFFIKAQPLVEAPLFFDHYAHDHGLIAFWLILIGTLALGALYVAVISVRTAQLQDPWLSRGLRLISLGAAAACFFLLTRCALIVDIRPRWLEPVAMASLVIAGCLIGIGALLPDAAARSRRAHALRQLGDLWEVATSRFPEVRADRKFGRRPRSLYRAVIEIQDAVAEARTRGEVADDVMRALHLLPARAADEQEALIDDLLKVAAAHCQAGR